MTYASQIKRLSPRNPGLQSLRVFSVIAGEDFQGRYPRWDRMWRARTRYCLQDETGDGPFEAGETHYIVRSWAWLVL